jgi:hypothetical protein
MWTLLDLFRIYRGDAPATRIRRYALLGALFWGFLGVSWASIQVALWRGELSRSLPSVFSGMMAGLLFGGAAGAMAGALTRQTFRGTLAWATACALLIGSQGISWWHSMDFNRAAMNLAFKQALVGVVLGGGLGAAAYTMFANSHRIFATRATKRPDKPEDERAADVEKL